MVFKGPSCLNILWLLWHRFDLFFSVVRPTHLIICSHYVFTLTSAGQYEKWHWLLFGGKSPQFSTVLSFRSTLGTKTETLCIRDMKKDHIAISTNSAYLEMVDKATHKRNVSYFFLCHLQLFVVLCTTEWKDLSRWEGSLSHILWL